MFQFICISGVTITYGVFNLKKRAIINAKNPLPKVYAPLAKMKERWDNRLITRDYERRVSPSPALPSALAPGLALAPSPSPGYYVEPQGEMNRENIKKDTWMNQIQTPNYLVSPLPMSTFYADNWSRNQPARLDMDKNGVGMNLGDKNQQRTIETSEVIRVTPASQNREVEEKDSAGEEYNFQRTSEKTVYRVDGDNTTRAKLFV